MLTLFVHEQDSDYKIIYAILESSQNIYYVLNKRKQFLSQVLNDHGIWMDTNIWADCIDVVISAKIEQSRLRMERKRNSHVRVSLSSDP